jgi:hypothetical protein
MGAGALALGGALAAAGTGAAASVAATTLATTDNDILNFLLNLTYLESNFYNFTVYGQQLDASYQTGTGTRGDAVGGHQLAPPTTFSDGTFFPDMLREAGEYTRVRLTGIRTLLQSAAVAQPSINLGTTATDPFSVMARNAGVITGVASIFDPFSSSDNCGLAAWLIEDVVLTAYRAALPMLADAALRANVARLFAPLAQYVAMFRTNLYARGAADASLRAKAAAFSDYRDSLDGSTDLDQPLTSAPAIPVVANVTPLDASGQILARSSDRVFNIFYGTAAAATAGGFFPNGVNGTINASAAH